MSLAALEAAKFAKILAGHHLSPTELGAGADYFIATNSTETFNGGSGRDTVSYHQSTTGVNVNFFDTGAETGGFARGDTLLFIENVIGSAFDDEIRGVGQNGTVDGGLGDNECSGFGKASQCNTCCANGRPGNKRVESERKDHWPSLSRRLGIWT